jgi:hypothetical protein
MSEFLRAAREKLRAALVDIDARLTELQAFKAEEADLLATRAQLATLIDGPNAEAATLAPSVGGRHVAAASTTGGRPAPAPASPVVPETDLVTGVRDVDAANRILAFVGREGEPVRYEQIVRVSRLSPWTCRRLVTELVTMGRLLRVGKTNAVRYSLPSGRAKRGPAGAAGKGTPADDDAHGAHSADTSAGDAGVSLPTPREPSLQQPVSRPPVVIPPDDHSAESLGKGSIADGPETDISDDDDPLDLDAADTAAPDDDDVLADTKFAELDADQAALDEEPCYPKKRGPKPKYKPGTRHEPAAAERAPSGGSWWTRPDANFEKEAQRMRESPRRTKTRGEDNIIGMNAVW